MKEHTKNTIDYRPEIDGLRAVAVLPVILFHAGFDIFSGGFIGVDVFFVISGYLITSILLKEHQQGTYSILKFYERRARRILPALFFVILVSIPLAWHLMLPDEIKLFGQSVFSVATFSSNLYFWLTTNYFSNSAEELPMLHTWSLAVEEQFYIIFPVFLAVAWRLFKDKILIVIFIMIILSILSSEYLWRYHPTANFYLLPTRAWELLLGAALAFPNIKSHCRDSMMSSILALFGLLAILLSVFVYDKNTPFPSLYSVLPVVGTCLVICFSSKNSITTRVLSSRFFVSIGLISYSLYLWHQPIFAFLRISDLNEESFLLKVASIGLSLLLAYLSWRYVEAPFRDKKKVKRKAIFSWSLSGIFACIAIGLMFHFNPNVSVQGTLYSKFSSNKGALEPNYGLPYPGCNAFDNKFSICRTKPDAQVFLWGDSFAAHLTQFFSEGEKGLVQATMSSCFPNTNYTPFESSGVYNRAWAESCNKFSNDAYKYVLETDSIEYVVISSTFSWPFNQRLTYDGETVRQVSISEYIDAISKDVRRLRAAGKKVVIVSPMPSSTSKTLRCAKKVLVSSSEDTAHGDLTTSHCNFTHPQNRVDVFLEKVIKGSEAGVFDFREVLCDGDDICSMFVNGDIVYRDWGHLSPYGAKVVQDTYDVGPNILAVAK
ncbi:acyltransferase [Corallincola holothuriorum]|uniref:Acyltransferase n=1 Tax=Corallincola holothuriorum TaxID=2282215 RepID=A0A368N3Q3_9GAMM|nr:acyltransferase family protein [Corallincola holothuriorum]RCU45162.1 acyltransferase [Corallincola holothuriorum]